MYKNKFFWIMVVLFLTVTGAGLYYLYPTSLAAIAENKTQIEAVKMQLDEARQLMDRNKALNSQADLISNLKTQSLSVIPESADPVMLMIRLDLLFKSIGISEASFNVPLTGTASTTTTNTAEPQPGGSGGASNITTKNAQNEIIFTAKVTTDYQKAKQTIEALNTMAPIVTLTNLELSGVDGKIILSVSAKSYAQAVKGTELKDITFLSQANDLFNKYHIYANPPTLESGKYGKSNPFQ